MEKIATFHNFGKLKLGIPSPPGNLADADATYMIATGTIPDDETITGNLYDASDNLVARGRVYSYIGTNRNAPFNILDGQGKYLGGETPDTTWNIPTIKNWLGDRQTKSVEGAVSMDDPYYYSKTANKTRLLEIVTQGKVAGEIVRKF